MTEVIIFNHYDYLVCIVEGKYITWEGVGGSIEPTLLVEIQRHMTPNTRDYTTLIHYYE